MKNVKFKFAELKRRALEAEAREKEAIRYAQSVKAAALAKEEAAAQTIALHKRELEAAREIVQILGAAFIHFAGDTPAALAIKKQILKGFKNE